MFRVWRFGGKRSGQDRKESGLRVGTYAPEEVVCSDEPTYERLGRLGPTPTELTTAEGEQVCAYRWPVEPNCGVAQATAGMEMPRVGTKQAREYRVRLASLVGGVLQALTAVCELLAIGPWNRQQRLAGRLAYALDRHAGKFTALALRGRAPRN